MWHKLIGTDPQEIDFDAYLLMAASGAEMWLQIHDLRQDIVGGFELTGNPHNPIKTVGLYWYPGYTQDCEGNLMILEHLSRRLVALGAPPPTQLTCSKVRLLWCDFNRTNYDPYFRIPAQFAKRLMLVDDLKKQVAA